MKEHPRKKRLEGIIVPVVTPFNAEEEIDESSLRTMVRFLVNSGVHGLFPVGSQGEFFSLSADEKKRVMEVVIREARGKVFVMPNTGCVTTRETIALSCYAEAAGADAISVITPYFITPGPKELYQHYAAVAEAVRLPVLAYNNPDRTGVNLTPSTVARLACEFPNFVGIKDSSGDLSQTLEYIRLCPSSFLTFMGRDTLIYAGLANGCVGAVAATANVVPELVIGIYEAVRVGDHELARALQRKLAPLRLAFQLGTFPAVVKAALQMIGRIPDGRARQPVGPLDDEARTQLRSILLEVGASL